MTHNISRLNQRQSRRNQQESKVEFSCGARPQNGEAAIHGQGDNGVAQERVRANKRWLTYLGAPGRRRACRVSNIIN